MNVREITTFVVVALGFAAVASHNLGCSFGSCGELEPVESGEYVITGLAYEDVDPDEQWLAEALPGSELSIDRAANTVTIRYTRDGSTYEVRHTIEKE